MELKRYWQIICKRRGTLLWIIGVMITTVMLGSFIISPVYKFSSNILIKAIDPKTSLFNMPNDITTLGIIDSDLVMHGQLTAIKNLSIIQDIIEKLHLEKKQGQLFGAADFLDAGSFSLLMYKRGVRVKIIPSTQIIQVSGFSGSPQEAAEIANETADKFVASFNRNIQTSTQRALRAFQENIPLVVAQLKKVEDDQAAYKVAHHLSDITELRAKWITALANLQNERDSNETELTEIRRRIGLIQAKLKAIPTFQKASAEYRSNATLSYLREKLMDAESSLAGNSVRATPEYVGQQQTMATLAKLKEEYRKQAEKLFYSETTVRNNAHTTLVTSLIENEINQVVRTSRRQILQQLILNKQKELDDLNLQELPVKQMQREIDAFQTILTNLYGQQQTAKIVSSMDLSNATIIERAVVPDSTREIKRFRWFPRRKLLLLLSFLLALLVGLSTIFLQEYLDDTFHEAQDAETFLPLPVLGSLPELAPINPVTMGALTASPPWALAMQTLSYRLNPSGTAMGVVAITSAAASEGKTLLTAGLGQALASRGLRVLMVDLNVSHPSLASLWEIPPGPGLIEMLRGKTEFSQSHRRVGSDELYLLPGGRQEELLSILSDLPALKNLLASLKNNFEAVLLDLPAIGEGEGAPLTGLADQVLMVAAANHTPRESVKNALHQIKIFQETVGGIILNRVIKIKSWTMWAQPFLNPLRDNLPAKLGKRF